ncbi:MAG: C-type lectin domain-containing protein [Byssovorax sp.]
MQRRTLAPLTAALGALLGCGGGHPLVYNPAPIEEPAPPSTAPARPAVTLNVAGPAPEDPAPRGPFDCNGGEAFDAAGQRYCLYRAPSTWEAAEARCVAHGGHLATIGSPAEENALFSTIGAPQGASSFWIGLAEPAEGRWLWSNASRVSFDAWNAGEPNNAGGVENCGEWLFPSARWNDLDCMTARPFLCETRLSSPRARPPACRGRGFVIGQSAYCLSSNDQTATWEDAQKACSKDGGTLAVIETEEENRAIGAALGARPAALGSSVWIGLNDRAEEGRFVWSSGEPVTHSAFRAGEPNNAGDEDCVEWGPGDARWNDLGCNAALPSLCQAPRGQGGALAWLGMSEDRVGEWGSLSPNGKLDGHFRITLPRGGLIRWISVTTVDAFGNPEKGQLWHTADPQRWVVGVLVDGQLVNHGVSQPLAEVRASATLDLFCSDSGFFKPGQRFAMEIMFGDGEGLRRIVEIPATR